MIKKIITKIYRTKEDITKEELLELLKLNSEAILLDVRSEQEFREGHLQGAINIPLYELYVKAEKMLRDKNAIIIAYCSVGSRSKKAIRVLKRLGYTNLYNLKNGID